MNSTQPPFHKKKIAVLIPCFNEESGIADVVRAFPLNDIDARGYSLDIIIIDNNSTDKTAEIAKGLGVTVLHEAKKGKGNAMRHGFDSLSPETDYVVMLDGDNTYMPEEILRLIELLDSDFSDVVIGSRLGGRITEGSMNRMNKVGNWIFSHMVRYFYRIPVTDVLTGYFAWKKDALDRLRPHLVSQGFALEMEMVTKMAKLGENISCVPISYNVREGQANLRPFYDGIRILWMFTKNLSWSPFKKRVSKKFSAALETPNN